MRPTTAAVRQGDELDRDDPRARSPSDEWIVATSQPPSRYYRGVLDDLLMWRDGLGGDENPDVPVADAEDPFA